MKFIQRIRVWLQKPWFVGVLSVVAILFSARNIVLPLMDISASNDELASGGGAMSGGLTSQLLPGAISNNAGEEAVDITALRVGHFGGTEYQRNPFLFADDPRQRGAPGAIVDTTLTKPTKVYVGGDSETVGVESLFSLNAILVRDGQKYALINRQVSAEGDAVTPSDSRVDTDALSESSLRQVKDLMAEEYTLNRIGQHDVEISSSAGAFTLSLGY